MSQMPPKPKPVTVPDFLSARQRGVKLSVLTAYDYTFARLLDSANVDAILVGDSLGMVVQGHANSLPVTLDEIIYHAKCVVRGTSRAMVIADLPFMSYQLSPVQALETSGRVLKEAGVHAVKLEGGERSAEAIAAIVRADIPVMGHVGLTPQSVQRFGGYKVQRQEEQILRDAKAVENAGAFSIVMPPMATRGFFVKARTSDTSASPTTGSGFSLVVVGNTGPMAR